MQFDKAEWRHLEARVDYFAGTTSDHKLGEYCYERARDIIENSRSGSLAGSGKSEQGYVGLASDHAFAGGREDGTYVRLSSDDARDYWREFVGAGLRTSRIDVCCTSECTRDMPNVAYSMRYDQRLPARIRGRLPGRTLFSTEDRGDTCYVGGADANQRGRVYDKAREKPGAYALGTWRFEVQCRHQPADSMGRALVGREHPERWIQTYVSNWFRDRGFETPIVTQDERWRDSDQRDTSSEAAKVAWLKRCIRPMLVKLSGRYTKRQLREILGLQYDPRERERGLGE